VEGAAAASARLANCTVHAAASAWGSSIYRGFLATAPPRPTGNLRAGAALAAGGCLVPAPGWWLLLMFKRMGENMGTRVMVLGRVVRFLAFARA
jgi:hypothetical protein